LPRGPALLVFYLAASLAAFGGIYSWALAPMFLGALLLTIVSVPGRSVASRGAAVVDPDTKSLDIAIGAFVVGVAIQLAPLPLTVRAWLAPHASDIDALRPDAAIRHVSTAPLSVDPAATAGALTLLITVALTYVAARRIFSTGGVRFVCSALSLVAAIAGAGALVQRALTPSLIYGFWRPEDTGGVPFGPVVNRNHFAAWLLMASALTAGYLIARISRRTHQVRGWRALKRMVVSTAQSSAAWTAALWLITTVTVLAAQSRSALLGLAVAAVSLMRSVTRTWRPVIVAAVVGVVAVVVLLAAGESTTTQMAERFANTLEASDIGRVVIWRETLPMISDFAVTGVGAGAFERAMLVYQQTRVFVPHLGTEWFFNHAHNHYLQLAAEGGLLLTLPFAVMIVLFARLAARRLREDVGELRTVRLGAIAGLAGVATQSLWEVPLTMPAAALLAAVLAALATYRRSAAGAELRTEN
jgi:O-antigen ligase